MNRKKYYDKLREWEAEGYDVSELRKKWFPSRKGRGGSHIGMWVSVIAVIFIAVAGIVVWQAMQRPPTSVPAVRIPSSAPTPTTTPFPAQVAAERYTLVISSSPSGAGSISPGSGTYDAGASVTLTATPTAGYRFDSWSGDVSSTSPTTTITMKSNKSVTANFAIVGYSLTSSVNPPGSGLIYPTKGTYNGGYTLTLTAVPSSGYEFDHWSGDASGTSLTVTIPWDSNKNVIANFVPVYNLSKSINPPEGGSITVSPPSAPYSAGTTVTLTATAAPGYRFSHWSGDAFGTSSITTITMDSNKTVIANFVIIRVSLITSVSPLGAGTVNPGSGTHDMGSKVTLTASPASGYRFASWSGDATGTSSTITVTMDSNKNIVANFVSEQLNISFGGWYVGGVKVDKANKGNNVVAKMTISGGALGQYRIRIRRDISLSDDQTVSELTVTHEGALSTKDLSFVAAYATGESSTKGYHIDVVKDGNTIWTLTDAYPPRLRVQ